MHLERARRAAADAARRSGPQAIDRGTIWWDPDTALTPAQRAALILLARELRDGDLIEYGAADVRTQRGDMGDVTVFVTELRDGATRIYLMDEEGGRHDG